MPTPITKQRMDQLVDNDFIRYNTFQDYSLKPNDFNDPKTFEEFALRYASTKDLFVRDKFSSAISRQLKIALCWELFLIYKNSEESDTFARKDIPEILKRDFKLDVKKITDKESIEERFMKFSYFFGTDAGIDTTNDAPQKIETTYFNYDVYAGGSKSLLLFDDYLLVDPSLTAIFMHMLAEQTIDGVKESINSVGWKLKPALSLSDREYEKWNLWGNGFAKKRYNGFKDSNVWDIEANSGASIDHPFDVPFALNTNLKLVRKIFNPPSVEGTNHRDRTEFNLNNSLTYDLSTELALLGFYTYKFKDNVYSYSASSSQWNNAALELRYRDLDGYFAAGLDYNDGRYEYSRNSSDGVTKESSNQKGVGGHLEYFKFLGRKSSFTLSGWGKYVKSEGDLNAGYPEFGMSVNGAFDILENYVRMSLTGDADYAPVYRDSKDYEFSATLSPSLSFTLSKTMSLSLNGYLSLYFNRGKEISSNDTSIYGDLNFTYANLFIDNLEATLFVYAENDWDHDFIAGKSNYDSIYFGAYFGLGYSQ